MSPCVDVETGLQSRIESLASVNAFNDVPQKIVNTMSIGLISCRNIAIKACMPYGTTVATVCIGDATMGRILDDLCSINVLLAGSDISP